MLKRRKWVMGAVCAVLGIVLFMLLTREREPSYKGKSLSRWLEFCAYEGATDDDNGPGAEAIRAMGTNALPYLVRWVSYDSSRSQSKNVPGSWGRKLPKGTPAGVRLWVMEDGNQTQAELAVLGFEFLGERANSAIPELTAVMNDQATTNRSLRTAMALCLIGREAIPSLSAQLANTNCSYRKIIAAKFGSMPGLATNESVVPPLLRCLNDPDPDKRVREAATNALLRIAPDTLTNAPALRRP